MPLDDLQKPFTLPPNPPKDIVISNEFKQEILIKNHFSAYIVFGPIMLAVGIPGLFFLIKQTESFDFKVLFGLILFLLLIGYGLFFLYAEIRNKVINISITVDNDFLKIKYSNMDQPIEIQRGIKLALLVDGIELYRDGPPTHRIIAKLAINNEVFANFGGLTKDQYIWLKELFLSYFSLDIVYQNKQLADMQL